MKISYLVLIIGLLFSNACNKSNNQKLADSVETSHAKPEQKGGAEPGKMQTQRPMVKIQNEDCLSEYKDLEQISEESGEVVKVLDLFMIEFGQARRVNPCNFPNEDYKVGDQVIFSGVIKESPAGVRLAGTPFKLVSIRLANE